MKKNWHWIGMLMILTGCAPNPEGNGKPVASVAKVVKVEYPDDVKEFISRKETCDHFMGEQGEDEARRRQIFNMIKNNCPNTDLDLKNLLIKYNDNIEVLNRLKTYKPLNIDVSGPSHIANDDDERWFFYKKFQFKGALYDCKISDKNPGETASLLKNSSPRLQLTDEVKQNGKIIAVNLNIPEKQGVINFIRGEKRCNAYIKNLNDSIIDAENAEKKQSEKMAEKYK